MSEQYILAIDQGTSGTKAVIFDSQGRIAVKATCPVKSLYPQPGFVEQNPLEIYQSVLKAVKQCLDAFQKEKKKPAEIVTCGISNQRETFVIWDKAGDPLTHAVVWQCKRSLDICNRLKDTDISPEVNKRTGLIIDPYFSGTKLIWLYENDESIRNAINAGHTYFGTVDSWLLFKLTAHKSYFTDYTNASRTLFFNIDDLKWDRYLLERFSLSGLKLPEVKPSAHLFGQSDFEGLFQHPIDIGAMIGDSHAAAFGEGCFEIGSAKATLGTGCSVLLNTGATRVTSKKGMVTTICWSTEKKVDYALEGVIVTCGATIKWLKDKLGLFTQSAETEKMALSVEDSNGVSLIPAFSGLGTPHWRMDLKAAIMGLTFDCDKKHIVRAALESIGIQIQEVIAAMEADSAIKLSELKVDGGITANTFVMQFLADLLNANVTSIGIEEVSALGAAYLAGLKGCLFESLDHLAKLSNKKKIFTPSIDRTKANNSCQQYRRFLQMLLQSNN
ncbi:MAG: glycerol kinase GlpK [Sedimentisphaerales bacterium]|nr:glycerol kinase GlpK [Sedimentisphaerales bacterium]